MPTWLFTIILGCIEGITEFLPISSTGHLLLAERWFGDHRSDLFNIVIQSGAVLAVIPLFSNRLRGMLFQWRNTEVRDYSLKLLAAFLITAVGGIVLDKMGFKLPENPIVVAAALLVGGILFVAIEHYLKGREGSESIGWIIAIAVGLGQLIAGVFPGSSRSGTTIILCLLLGLSRPAATEFSFLVGIPTMLAAGGWKIVKTLLHRSTTSNPAEDWMAVLLGFITAGLVSFLVVRWLLGYIRTHTFAAFGWYRIALALLILAVAQ